MAVFHVGVYPSNVGVPDCLGNTQPALINLPLPPIRPVHRLQRISIKRRCPQFHLHLFQFIDPLHNKLRGIAHRQRIQHTSKIIHSHRPAIQPNSAALPGTMLLIFTRPSSFFSVSIPRKGFAVSSFFSTAIPAYAKYCSYGSGSLPSKYFFEKSVKSIPPVSDSALIASSGSNPGL